MNAPLIPARLARRPTAGGLVIPWVTVVLADGSPDWRACIRHRVNQCILQRRCQLDGQVIPDAAVFIAAADQMPTEPGEPVVTDIPPVHPECLAYATLTCPMLNGQRNTYADRPRRTATSKHNRCTEPGCSCGGWVSVDDRDKLPGEVDGWFAVWATDWTATQPDGAGAHFAVIATPRRVRPIGTPS